MPWHFNNLTTLTPGLIGAIPNLSAFINPNDPGIHGPTRHSSKAAVEAIRSAIIPSMNSGGTEIGTTTI